MRWLAAGALVFALAPATAQASPRAAILFLPYDGDARPLLQELAKRPGMAIGLTSPTVGGFSPQQMALDMSQGTRIPTRLYPRDVPVLVRDDSRLRGWAAARKRARDAPGDLVPGLLGTSVERTGKRIVYAGGGTGPALGAIVAADERGVLGNVSAATWGGADVLVADLPRGTAGLDALDAVLATRGPGDLVYVAGVPSGHKTSLLASGIVGLRGGGELRSATTRQTGLIAATDVAPTVLARLGVAVPDAMQGQPIEARDRRDPAALADLDERLAVVASRRGTALAWLFGALLFAVAVLAAFGRVRTGVRLAALSALWAPGLMLVTAALAPGRTAEAAIIALGSVAAGIATELFVRWPRAPVVPAVVVFVAYAVDLARGSPLVIRSLAGPNPAGGARFYGIGNELETILSFLVLFGAGAGLAWLGRRSPLLFATAAAVAAIVIGAGRLGADVGAVITLAIGGAAAVLASRGGRPSRRAFAVAIGAPIAALIALALIDLATGGDAHLTRSVLRAHSGEDLTDVLTRRMRAAISPLGHPGKLAVFAVGVGIVTWLVAIRERIFSPLAREPSGEPMRAGLIGAAFAVVAATLANDSGPLILEIGAVLLLLGSAYVAAAPLPSDA